MSLRVRGFVAEAILESLGLPVTSCVVSHNVGTKQYRLPNEPLRAVGQPANGRGMILFMTRSGLPLYAERESVRSDSYTCLLRDRPQLV